jgi:hypothetical protein
MRTTREEAILALTTESYQFFEETVKLYPDLDMSSRGLNYIFRTEFYEYRMPPKPQPTPFLPGDISQLRPTAWKMPNTFQSLVFKNLTAESIAQLPEIFYIKFPESETKRWIFSTDTENGMVIILCGIPDNWELYIDTIYRCTKNLDNNVAYTVQKIEIG